MTDRSGISRRALLLAAAAGLVPAGAARAGGHAHHHHYNKDRLVVVELFTSQGCSNCPPADAFMRELVRHENILGLTYNVDYWDYLGWRDTLASPDFTRRQEQYAAARGDTKVYTPQMIVNGKQDVIGNKHERVLELIEKERRQGDCRHVDLKIAEKDGMLLIDAGPATEMLKGREATLWVVTAMKEVTVEIAKGENRGRKLTYANVVRKIVPVAVWRGKRMHIALPRAQLFVSGAKTCAALLQLDDHGPIIGAARLRM